MATVDRRTEDAKIDRMRTGSITMMAGWILLGMAILFGVFVFQEYRDGTHLWRYFIYGMGLIGLVLVLVGARQRKMNS